MKKWLFFFLLFLFSCQKETKRSLEIITGDKLYEDGVKLIQKNDIQAYLKFQQAISYYVKYNDSSNISKSYICQAVTQKNTGDFLGAEATLVEALKYMQADDESLFSVYDTMGNIKLDQNDYSKAIVWYDKALSENIESYETIASILNNKSVAEFKIKNYFEALKILQKIDLSKIEDIKLINRIKENIEYVKWLSDNNYPAQKEIEKIISDKLRSDDLWGLNSSYSHLAEINKKSNPKKSLFYSNQMLEIAKIIKSPEDRLEAMEKILLVDNPSNFKSLFIEYKNLSDSIRKSRDNNKERFAYIRYDSEKKNTENQKLKTIDAQNQNRILIRNIALLLSFLAIVVGIFWYRKRKKRLEQEKEILKQEKEIEVKNTQLKYSKKVHDVVANGLYQTMVEIENQPKLDKEKVLNNIEKLYEESRDITQDDFTEIPDKEFSIQLSQMISSYNSDNQKIFIAGNEQKLWEKISPNIQSELYYVIRELLVNMKKHSHAKLISLKFEKNEDILKIKYVDNGIGINDLETKNGSGIKNTENRIASIGGEINFEKNPKGGLIVNISIPIN